MRKLFSIFFLGLTFIFSSCIQDEPLNAECDIESVDSIWLANNKDILIGSPVVTNTAVSFTVKKGTDRTHLNPAFNLTPGAKLTMQQEGLSVEANGVMRDFTTSQIYTTISEDGEWSKDYTVSFNYPRPATTCSFEHFELDKSERYYVWYELDESDVTNPRRDDWSTGNAGFAFTGKGKKPVDYPTFTIADGVKGNGVGMITRSTGSFGAIAKMPIAAGNIFVGEFRSEKATIDPMGATRFGKQEIVGGKPLYLSGYYKFKAGETFTDKKGKVDPTRHDTCDIYSVLYEVDPDNFISLQGDDVLTSDRIVALARIDDPGEPETWTRFEIPFKYKKNFEKDRVQQHAYAIAIVATSSRWGAYFEGAIGSELYIDELKITWEE